MCTGTQVHYEQTVRERVRRPRRPPRVSRVGTRPRVRYARGIQRSQGVHQALSAEPGHSFPFRSTWLFAHSVPVYLETLAASSSLAWPLVHCSAEREHRRGFKRGD